MDKNMRKVNILIAIIIILTTIVVVSFINTSRDNSSFVSEGKRFTWCDGKIHEHEYHNQSLPDECLERLKERKEYE